MKEGALPGPGPRMRGYGLLADLLLPAAALWAALRHRTRRDLAERLAWRPPRVEPGCLWIHGASLGEGRVVAALVAALQRSRPDLPLLRTATSDTGRRQQTGADCSCCLPLDAPWLLKRFMRRVRPRALVLVEGELWPGLLLAAAGRIPVAVLGARVGPGTRGLAQRFPGLFGELGRCAGTWLARSQEDADWLAPRLGREVPQVGDLKGEAPLEPAPFRWSRPCLVAGSTREGDEERLLDALQAMPAPPGLLLAPRHPERFPEVARLLERRGLAWGRRSGFSGEQAPADWQVLLLDSVGELGRLYAQADAAFVGGTFDVKLGGHSAAEAVRAGLPVVHGPHIFANRSSFQDARCFPAPRAQDLADALQGALAAPRSPPPEAQASARAVKLLAPLLDAPTPAERSHRPLLWPLVPLYLGAGRARRLLRRPRAASIPVISVGNLASGGTGKTPVTAWLAHWFAAHGVPVAVVSRGYRRSTAGPLLRDSRQGPLEAAWLGDESAMLARQGLLTVSCPQRRLGVARAAELGARLALLDDGFQQRDVRNDLDIVLLDAREPGAGGPIPVGERREPFSSLARASLVWCNHGALPPQLERHLAAGATRVRTSYHARDWWGEQGAEPLAALAGQQVCALAGIARPAAFFAMLRRAGVAVARQLVRPDHHAWSAAELKQLRQRAGGLPLVTTEKDLARLPPGSAARALRIELRFERGAGALRELLSSFAARHGVRLEPRG